MRSRGFGLVPVVFISFGCGLFKGGGNPAGPTPPVGLNISITITDGLTNERIVTSGQVVYGSGSVVEITNGSAELQNVNIGEKVTISNIPGYRNRNTLYCGQNDFLLWMDRPGDVDDALTKNMAYTDFERGSQMQHPPGHHLNLVPSAEIWADSRSMATLREAASRVMAVVNGKTIINVTDVSGQLNTITVSVDPTHIPAHASAIGDYSLTPVYGGYIHFRTIDIARNVRVTMHEIIHTMGISGHNPYPGLMNGSSLGSDFTVQEKHTLLLRYTRRTGSLYMDDNDQVDLNRLPRSCS